MSDTLVVNEIYLSLQGESTFAGLPCVFVRLTACDLRCSYCDTAYAFTQGKKQTLEDVRAEVNRLAVPFRDAHSALPTPHSSFHTPHSALRTPHSALPTPHSAPSIPHSAPLTPHSAFPIPHSALRTPHSPALPLVELTGGEPLLQKGALPLMAALCDDEFTVLLETSGAHDISQVDPRVRRIMDLKCPSSGEVDRNRWENLPHLRPIDEIKFVIGTREDYEWAKSQISTHKLAAVCPLLMSWVHPLGSEQQDKSLKKVPTGQTAISRQELAEIIIADALPVRFQVQMHKVIWPPEMRGV